MPNLKDIILEYYTRIDASDLDWVLSIFANNCRYNRAGQIIQGSAEIEHFYKSQRKVKLAHSQLESWHDGANIFVNGLFKGTGADGSVREGEFMDHWQFNSSTKVISRKTSLFSGSNFIEK